MTHHHLDCGFELGDEMTRLETIQDALEKHGPMRVAKLCAVTGLGEHDIYRELIALDLKESRIQCSDDAYYFLLGLHGLRELEAARQSVWRDQVA